jgi:hypothetical protein
MSGVEPELVAISADDIAVSRPPELHEHLFGIELATRNG